jgi:hypothetical protein
MIEKPNFSRREERGKAEATAIEYVKQKHNEHVDILLRTIYHEGTVWVILGEVRFKKAHFFEKEKSFIIKINPKTETVESYLETAFLPKNESKSCNS